MTVLPLTPDELLTTTRSVRKRLDLTRPVPMDLITECLQIALQSPSAGNSQSWHSLVITDSETRAAIGELYRRSTERYLAARQRQAQQRGGPPPGSAAAKTMLRIRISLAATSPRDEHPPGYASGCPARNFLSRSRITRSTISIANLASGSPNWSPSVRSSWRMR